MILEMFFRNLMDCPILKFLTGNAPARAQLPCERPSAFSSDFFFVSRARLISRTLGWRTLGFQNSMQVFLEATRTVIAQALRPDMTGRTDSDTSSVHADAPPSKPKAMFAEEPQPPKQQQHQQQQQQQPTKNAFQDENTRLDDEERDAIRRRFANRGTGAYATARGGAFAASGRDAFAADHGGLSMRERIAVQSARLKEEQTTARNREKAARERARRMAQLAAQHTAEENARREAQREEARRNIASRRAQLEDEARHAREAEMRARVAAAKFQSKSEPPVDLRSKQRPCDEAQPTGSSKQQPREEGAFKAGSSCSGGGGGGNSSRAEFLADWAHDVTGGSPRGPESAIDRALRCGLNDVHGALGVSRGCQDQALHKAWRRACLEVHPDRNFGNEEAAARAQQIVNAAHDLLKDTTKLRIHEAHVREEAAKAEYAKSSRARSAYHTGNYQSGTPGTARGMRSARARPGTRARGDPRRQTAASTARGKGSHPRYPV